MTDSPMRAFPTIGDRLLTSLAILLGLVACSDRSVPPPSKGGTLSQPGGITARQGLGAEAAAAIHARLTDRLDPALDVWAHAERADLKILYHAGGYAPLWVDEAGRPGRSARDALTLLDDAATEGLNPNDYRATWLRHLAVALEAAEPPLPQQVATFDVGMSVGVLRYFRQLHMGRVNPRAIGFRMTAPAEKHDFPALLRSALASDRIRETAEELTPPLAQYRALRTMLSKYRSLAADTTLESLPPPRRTVRPGEGYAGLRALYRRLVAFGDLPGHTPAPAESAAYEGALVDGVKRFQIRHGLASDGIVGKGTHAALNVPIAWRVRQIELALERLRWLPDLGKQRLLALNIPMFHLWAWDAIPPSGEPLFGMGVIVGRALDTQTPVFVEDMRYVIFRPYWNVPRSILRDEILPALERDPDYLRRHDLEIVREPGDDAQPVAATAENLALLREGVLRLRQRPGPRNALGLVKFVFPNDENVYMHGTPAQELFSRTRRDFSHGCVRVEDPIALAEWALKEQPEWTRERILAAMSGTSSRRVNLTRPIQVILFYTTAIVMPEDGTIRFAEDIYRQDMKLERALARQRPGGWVE